MNDIRFSIPFFLLKLLIAISSSGLETDGELYRDPKRLTDHNQPSIIYCSSVDLQAFSDPLIVSSIWGSIFTTLRNPEPS